MCCFPKYTWFAIRVLLREQGQVEGGAIWEQARVELKLPHVFHDTTERLMLKTRTLCFENLLIILGATNPKVKGFKNSRESTG